MSAAKIPTKSVLSHDKVERFDLSITGKNGSTIVKIKAIGKLGNNSVDRGFYETEEITHRDPWEHVFKATIRPGEPLIIEKSYRSPVKIIHKYFDDDGFQDTTVHRLTGGTTMKSKWNIRLKGDRVIVLMNGKSKKYYDENTNGLIPFLQNSDVCGLVDFIIDTQKFRFTHEHYRCIDFTPLPE